MRIENERITLIRGDSAFISVGCVDENDVAIPLVAPTDVIYLTIKRSVGDMTKVLQKKIITFQNGKAEIELTPTDTKDIAPGDYVYDVQLNKMEGELVKRTFTIIEPNAFIVVGDVTRE